METLDKIRFEVNVELIDDLENIAKILYGNEEDYMNYDQLYQAIVCHKKANEQDPEQDMVKGTRRPGNRAERRKATAKAKKHLREIEPFTMSVRRTRNGGVIKRGDTYTWLPEWKSIDRRSRRHDGKEICRKYEDEDLLNVFEDEDIDPEGKWDGEKFIPNEDPTMGLNAAEIECMVEDYAFDFLRETGKLGEFIEFAIRQKKEVMG